MKADDLIARYKDGERDFAAARLVGAHLAAADLSRADLSGAKLALANLAGAKLGGSTVCGSVHNYGCDHRGYNLLVWELEKGALLVTAGCREFPDVEAALAHWGAEKYRCPDRGSWFVRRLLLAKEELTDNSEALQ